MKVYLARRGSRRAHRRADCVYLTRRPSHCGPPMEVEVEVIGRRGDVIEAGWVAYRRVVYSRVAVVRARLCVWCGQP